MYVLDLEEAGRANECGFKAAALSGLRAIVPVPSGFVITPDALDAFLSANGLKEKVKGLSALAAEEHGGANGAEKRVRDAFINAVVPGDIKVAVARSYGGLSVSHEIRSAGTALGLMSAGKENHLVAVRPSVARMEGDTFAGVLDSFINVSGEEDIMRCVKLCWASLFYPRAAAYMERKGVQLPSMSVIVQRVAPCEKSGSILTGFFDDNVLVEAIWGPGNAASAGIVTPDEYLLRGDGRFIGKNVAKKLWMFERNDYTGVTSKVYVPAARMEAQVLTDQELRKLFELAIRISGDGKAQYVIDWSLGRNRVMITDAKPVKYAIEKPGKETGDAAVTGRFVSMGNAIGKVRRVDCSAAVPPSGSGDILVLESSDVGALLAAGGAAGVVADEGGRLCNMGVIARELGIPALAATGNARSVLPEGRGVRLLAGAEKVVLLPDVDMPPGGDGGVMPVQELAGTLASGESAPSIACGTTDGEIGKVLMEVTGEAGAGGSPVMVFARTSPEAGWNVPGAEGFMVTDSTEYRWQDASGTPGVPTWISCTGEGDFPRAVSLARRLADSGAKGVGILAPVVRGKEDLEKFRYVMPAGVSLGARLKTPAMLLSPDVSCEGVSVVDIELEPLMQLSMGLQKPGNHIHPSVLEMIGKVCEFCRQKGITCCATLPAQHITDWNLGSLSGKGVSAVCVDYQSVQAAKAALLRISKSGAKPCAPDEAAPPVQVAEEKSQDGFMPFDLGPSFS